MAASSQPASELHMNLRQFLDAHIERSLLTLGATDSPALVKQAGRPEFGHYQVNGVMGAAKKLGKKPRDLAGELITALESSTAPGKIASLEIGGPGFVNITLKPDFIAGELSGMREGDRLGINGDKPQHFVVDYSSPNLAKEMHIGHLRSTAMGDAAVRVLEFLGHKVTRVNHVGDWGAQFGSLLAYMERLSRNSETDAIALPATELTDLEAFYQKASHLFKTDETFANEARQLVVRLQNGDARCLKLWQLFIDESLDHCQATYDALDISLTREDVRAESAYNSLLPEVIKLLEARGLIQESAGAKCVFLDEFIGKDGTPLPAIVQKSDGGYPYMATDLAAVLYRVRELGADQVIYFVDSRQSLHLAQLFAISRAAGFITAQQQFKHIPFGTILNKAGTPLKTREGGVVKLTDVITEAIERALALVSDKSPDLTAMEQQAVARVIGIGAIKYAELSRNRVTDYVFDWDAMLTFEGNTAPYLQYAYSRIRSIFRRENIDPATLGGTFRLGDVMGNTPEDTSDHKAEHGAEMALAIKLLQYAEAVDGMTDDYQANVLCNYLFELSGQFMSFYEACPVLKAKEPLKQSRLLLCDLTARVLQHGLHLLGINTVERM